MGLTVGAAILMISAAGWGSPPLPKPFAPVAVTEPTVRAPRPILKAGPPSATAPGTRPAQPPPSSHSTGGAPGGGNATLELHAPKPTPLMTLRQANLFMDNVARRESHAQAPGVMHDHETGLTFDGHAIDFATGQLVGGPRNWSAPSKESLDITLLVKAVQGDRVARLALSPSGKPEDAVPVAIERLTRKIESYHDFDKRHPGFGGFLPWFTVAGEPGERHMEPMGDWGDRVPALDNGQLAWSLYHAATALKDAGHPELAAKYQAHEKLMSKNVVRMFFDPVEKTLRAEAKMLEGASVAPKNNRYITNPDNKYYLNDNAEGLLMVHYADLFGKWKDVADVPGTHVSETAHTDNVKLTERASVRDELWTIPRRSPATYVSGAGEKITTEARWRSSAHEDWGHTVLPFRDVAIANRLFLNEQSVRTGFAAEGGRPGLYASTHLPQVGNAPPVYENKMGIPAIGMKGTEAIPVYAPYAAFPLALADKKIFGTWMKNMLDSPRTFGPNGIGESFNGNGKEIAPLLTWDGKALPLVAWSGGVTSEIRANLKRDGKYDRFISTVTAGYARFSTDTIGDHFPISVPTKATPRGMSDFTAAKTLSAP